MNGPSSPDAHWDKVCLAGQGGVCETGFVTDEDVDTKNDIDDPSVIPWC